MHGVFLGKQRAERMGGHPLSADIMYYSVQRLEKGNSLKKGEILES